MEDIINSLWPSDAIWQHSTDSTLDHGMACCLTAPSHYLTNVDLSVGSNDNHPQAINQSKRDTSIINSWVSFKITSLNFFIQITPANELTHWGRVTHIFVKKLTIIGSNNGLSPSGHQAILWTNAGILLMGPLGTNFNEILIEIHTFSFKKMHLKISSVKWRPFCLGLNVLTHNWCSGTYFTSEVYLRLELG